MRIRNLIVFLAITIVTSGAFSQSAQTKEIIASIDKLIAAQLDSFEIEGMAYCLVDHDDIICSKGFGYADVSAKCLMTDTSITNFASVSKSLTAVGVMMLGQRNVIDINNPVGYYLRSWSLPDTPYNKSEVTVKKILNHKAGLSLISVPFSDGDSTPLTVREVLDGKNAESQPVHVKFKPDSTWMYSGGGYTLLELLVEEVTRKRFSEYMQTNLFSPLSMHHSSFAYTHPGQICSVKHYDDEGHFIKPYFTVGAAAGGLHSTVRDMGVFCRELIRMHSGKSHLLSKKYFKEMINSTTPVDLSLFGIGEKGIACGLGLFVHKSEEDTVIYHSGGNPGVIAYFITSLDKNKALVLVSNSDKARPLVQNVLQLWGQLNTIDLPFFF